MLLAEKEKWDFSLYHFALELFAKQRERYPPVEERYPQAEETYPQAVIQEIQE